MSEQVRLTRAERQTQTRERLMEAASQVFAERGVAAASVEEICERAGFTRGAFYSNFESKLQLCLAIVGAHKDATLGTLENISAQLPVDTDDPVETVLTMFLSQALLGRPQMLLHQELSLLAQRDPSFREAFSSFVAEAADQTVELIVAAFRRHGRRLTINARDAARMLEAVFLYTEREAALFGDADGGHQRVRDALALMINAISE